MRPGGRPDPARPAIVGEGVTVARVRTSGVVDGPVEVMAEADPHRLLGTQEVARLLGLSRATWSAYVSRGYAPPPVDPGDVSRPPNMRKPRWSLEQVREYREGRKRRWFRKP